MNSGRNVLKVTVVGQELFKIVEEKCELVGLNPVNQVNTGMLGNLKTLTLVFEMPENKIIRLRRNLMEKLIEDNLRLTPMYVHGEWMRIFVFKPLRM